MRIAVFSDNFYPELSGISDSIVMTARELAKRGHEIHFFVPKYSRKDYGFLGLPEAELDLGENISITRVPSLRYSMGTGQGRFVIPLGFTRRKVREFRPDIIHVHLPFSMGIEGLCASRALKVPLVGTDHTILGGYVRYSPVRSKILNKALLRIIQAYNRWFYNHCDFVSSPSNAVFRVSRVRPPHKVVSNPIELSIFSSSGIRPNKKKYGFSDFTVMYAGRLASEKNVDVLIKALAIVKPKIPGIMLALAGRGAAEKELKGLASSLGVDDSVRFLGFLVPKKFAEVYKSCEVFAIMSTVETQSIVAMKAMASGLPVIAADAYGLSEYVGGNGILVNPRDHKAVAEKILFLYKHPAKRKQMGERGRKFVQRMAPKAIADKWESIYAGLCHGKNRKKRGR